MTDLTSNDVWDVVIIGAGPGGATAAQYAARAQLKTLMIDKARTTGALAIARHIENYPGVPEKMSGLELLNIMHEQALTFGAVFKEARVVRCDLKSDPKVVYADEPYKTRAIIVASGGSERAARVSGEEEFLGRGVSYCATCDGAFYKGHTVAVVGRDDEAIEEAVFLTKFADRVIFVAPGKKIQSAAGEAHRLEENPKIEVITGKPLKEIRGDQSGVTSILVGAGAEQQQIDCTGAFVYLSGNNPATGFLEGSVDAGEGGCLLTNRETETPIPGVFAIGDVVCARLKQAVIAASEGSIAAMAADRYLSGNVASPGKYY